VQSWNPNACSISAPLPEPETAHCSHKVSHNTATAFEMPCNSQHGAAGSSAETLAVPLRCATAQNQGGFRSAPLPHSISSGAGAAAAGAGGLYSRHKALLELWHILTKLRASGCCTLVRQLQLPWLTPHCALEQCLLLLSWKLAKVLACHSSRDSSSTAGLQQQTATGNLLHTS
jgi:hypothetical protein